MKKLIPIILLAIIGIISALPIEACTCMGRIERNTPAFFIEEYEQENELTENVDTDTEILHVDMATPQEENA